MPGDSISLEKDKKDFFDENEVFFLIDSEHLSEVQTRLYGYLVQRSGIYEDGNLTDDAVRDMDGCGVYVYVEKVQGKIHISQDFLGCYGIFIFQKNNYFALSNSFFRLLDYVKFRFPLSINRDYVNHFLLESMAIKTCQETAVNEIRILDRGADISIDIETRSMNVEYISYGENTIPLDSKEAVEILDSWFTKWTSIIYNLRGQTDES